MSESETWRAGSLRHWDEVKSEWVVTEPGSPWFSTATMLATEYWKDGEWVKIFEDDEGANTD
jgi:hypothetical protein